MPTIYSRESAYLGAATLGYTRLDVYTSDSEWMFYVTAEYRTFTFKRLKKADSPETLTGQDLPVYDDYECQGILVSKGANLPSFAVGVVMTEDAVFFTLDPVGVRGNKAGYLDRIVDPQTDIVYEVAGVQRFNDPKVGGLGFYIVQMHRLELEE